MQRACRVLWHPKKLYLSEFFKFLLEIARNFAPTLSRIVAETINKRLRHSNDAAYYDEGDAAALRLLFCTQNAE